MKTDFKFYYKFPLNSSENVPYVFTYNGKMALMWCLDVKESDRTKIINKINGYSKEKFEKEWTIKDNLFIYYGEVKTMLVRGWGMLTGSGSFNLPQENAAKIQDEFAKHIVNTLNS